MNAKSTPAVQPRDADFYRGEIEPELDSSHQQLCSRRGERCGPDEIEVEPIARRDGRDVSARRRLPALG
jgi:hypothetical protein